MNMYVGNLNYRVKEGDLEQAMAAYGVVTSVKVIKDRETGKSKGFAFVEMEKISFLTDNSIYIIRYRKK